MAGILDFLVDDLPPRERGLLDAHRISAGPIHVVRRCLQDAKRSRHSPLNWILWNRGTYFAGLVQGLERAIDLYEQKHQNGAGDRWETGSTEPCE